MTEETTQGLGYLIKAMTLSIVIIVCLIALVFYIILRIELLRKNIKKKRLIEQFKDFTQQQIDYESNTHMKMYYFSDWFIQREMIKDILERIKEDYKGLK